MSAALALRKAVHARLSTDKQLGVALGGAKIFDEVPGDAVEPYVVLAGIESRDASTGTEAAEEHRLGIDVWSRQGGLAEALSVAAQVVSLLDEAPLAPAPYRLIDLRWLATDARRSGDLRYRIATLTFRALTEA